MSYYKTMIEKRTGVLFLVPVGVLLVPVLTHFRHPQSSLQAQDAPSYRPQTGPAPRFVTYHLAEVHLTSNRKWSKGNDYGGKYDLKSNYSIRDGDGPNGCEYILTLQPGSSWDSDREELREVFGGVRLKLVTGRGVSIGDTPQEVERKIGKPTVANLTGRRRIRDNQSYDILPSYIYSYRGKRLYQARYSFRNGKLIEMMFRDAQPPNKYTGPNGGCP